MKTIAQAQHAWLTIILLLAMVSAAHADQLDYENFSYNNLTPGVSTLDDTIRELGTPTLNRGNKVLIYGKESIMVHFDKQQKIIGIYLMMTPKVDIITPMSYYKELSNGNPDFIKKYGALYPYEKTKELPNARVNHPRTYTVVWVSSATEKSIGFVYQGAEMTLCQIAVVNF
ncbi:MAG: hypothetical protein A2511_06740 [Deltaproteobacteria bacterium RIFOXYD12_FULL_50_9]|nr:MAG: hypothetical protein A2511_06740 [Deltaproteobacteria bacterium RIFOXYD12_FULL_50_9]